MQRNILTTGSRRRAYKLTSLARNMGLAPVLNFDRILADEIGGGVMVIPSPGTSQVRLECPRETWHELLEQTYADLDLARLLDEEIGGDE